MTETQQTWLFFFHRLEDFKIGVLLRHVAVDLEYFIVEYIKIYAEIVYEFKQYGYV